MSIAEFSAAIKDKANTKVRAEASKMLDELVAGALKTYNSSNELIQASSVLNKGTFKRYAKKSGKVDTSKIVSMNLTEAFRETGEKQGNTALVITGSDLELIFKTLGITTGSNDTPMAAYVKFLSEEYGSRYNARHFEVYTQSAVYSKGNGNVGNKKLGNILNSATGITAIRSLNFSHANALTHLAMFIKKKVPGKSNIPLLDIEKEISSKFHRGHIYAQTTGRAQLSTKLIEDRNSPLVKLVELSKLLDEVSSGLHSNNIELLYNIDKDFSSNSTPRMNVGFQLITDDSGTGNADTGKLSASLRIVGMLQNLIDNSALSQSLSQIGKTGNGIRLKTTPIATNISNLAKVLDNFIDKLDADNSEFFNKVNNLLSTAVDKDYLLNLRSSDSMKEFAISKVAAAIQGKKVPTVRVKRQASVAKTPKKTVNLPKLSNSAKVLLDKVKKETTKVLNLSGKVRNDAASVSGTNLTSLQILINTHLQDVISANMGSGNDRKVLNYRTGRFAASASVERMSESREGMITAFYTYMQNPYATFSDGGKQQYPKTRDPKLLIGKSIKEIAATQVGNRLRAVLV